MPQAAGRFSNENIYETFQVLILKKNTNWHKNCNVLITEVIDIMNLCIYNNYDYFEWDEQKREANLKKHGYDFCNVHEVFAKRHIVLESGGNYDEQRYIAIGVFDRETVAVVYTVRGTVIRVISFRRASRKERSLLLWQL